MSALTHDNFFTFLFIIIYTSHTNGFLTTEKPSRYNSFKLN